MRRRSGSALGGLRLEPFAARQRPARSSISRCRSSETDEGLSASLELCDGSVRRVDDRADGAAFLRAARRDRRRSRSARRRAGPARGVGTSSSAGGMERHGGRLSEGPPAARAVRGAGGACAGCGGAGLRRRAALLWRAERAGQPSGASPARAGGRCRRRSSGFAWSAPSR